MGDFPAGDVIKQRLGAVPGVMGLVGVPPSDRIYKFWGPENPTYPFIAFRQLSAKRLTGTYDDPGVVNVTLVVLSVSKTMDGAHALDKQVRLALERYGANQPAGIPFAGTTLYDITVGSSVDGYTEDAQSFVVSTDYTVTCAE